MRGVGDEAALPADQVVDAVQLVVDGMHEGRHLAGQADVGQRPDALGILLVEMARQADDRSQFAAMSFHVEICAGPYNQRHQIAL